MLLGSVILTTTLVNSHYHVPLDNSARAFFVPYICLQIMKKSWLWLQAKIAWEMSFWKRNIKEDTILSRWQWSKNLATKNCTYSCLVPKRIERNAWRKSSLICMIINLLTSLWQFTLILAGNYFFHREKV